MELWVSVAPRHCTGDRRYHLRALAQRVVVDSNEVRIMNSKSKLLRTLVELAAASCSI